jgi:hypothetical protein
VKHDRVNEPAAGANARRRRFPALLALLVVTSSAGGVSAQSITPPAVVETVPPATSAEAPAAIAPVAPSAAAPLAEASAETAAPVPLGEAPRAPTAPALSPVLPSAASPTLEGVSANGFLQADYTSRQSSADEINYTTGDPLNENRFLVRRARLALSIDRPYTQGAVELDGNTARGVTARLVRAEATLRLPGAGGAPSPAAVTVGLFKIPFGFEVVQSDKDRFFAERSTASRALFPGEYDLGGRLAGGWGFLRYAVAVQNGDPTGEKAFPGRDPNGAKDLVGRVGVDASGGGFTLTGGVSALRGRGFHKGTAGTKDVLVWRDYNENGTVDGGELQIVPGQAPQASKSFARSALGADLRLSFPMPLLGTAMVAGEVWSSTNLDRGVIVSDPVASSRDLRQLGYSASFTQALGFGVSLGVRYDRYDPDRDAQDTRGGKVVPSSSAFTTLAVAGELRVDRFRLLAEYDVNRNHQGRDAEGRPTSLADNLLLVRGEVVF